MVATAPVVFQLICELVFYGNRLASSSDHWRDKEMIKNKRLFCTLKEAVSKKLMSWHTEMFLLRATVGRTYTSHNRKWVFWGGWLPRSLWTSTALSLKPLYSIVWLIFPLHLTLSSLLPTSTLARAILCLCPEPARTMLELPEKHRGENCLIKIDPFSPHLGPYAHRVSECVRMSNQEKSIMLRHTSLSAFISELIVSFFSIGGQGTVNKRFMNENVYERGNRCSYHRPLCVCFGGWAFSLY